MPDTFKARPILVNFVEISVVKWAVQRCRILVVKHTKPGELIVIPLAVIGYFARLIKKLSLTGHLVLAPLTIIETAVLVVELTTAITHIVQFVALVLRTLLEDLNHECSVRL